MTTAVRDVRAADDRAAVGERPQVADVGQRGARDVERHGLGPRREQQAAVLHRSAVGEHRTPPRDVELADLDARHELDLLLGEELGRHERQPLLRCLTGEEILREIRPVDGRRGFRADESHGTAVAFPSQGHRRHETRRSGTHDDDRVGRRRRCAPRDRVRLLRPDAHAVAFANHAPRRHRIQGGGPERFARPAAEAGVMPRASDGVADDQSLREGSAVVRAGRAGGEDFLAAAPEDHGILADAAGEDSPVGNRRDLHAGLEVRARRGIGLAAHAVHSMLPPLECSGRAGSTSVRPSLVCPGESPPRRERRRGRSL